MVDYGTIIDGTGAPAFTADIAIDGETISAVGQDLTIVGHAQEINAKGLLVAPGWIDVPCHLTTPFQYYSLRRAKGPMDSVSIGSGCLKAQGF